MPSARLELKLLGPFSLHDTKGAAIPVPAGKLRALLAYLALNAGERQPRTQLAALLWGDQGEESARNSLNQCLFRIRKSLGPHAAALVSDRESVMLDGDLVAVDCLTFRRQAAQDGVTALSRAVDFYGGEFLAGETTSEPSFEEWMSEQRDALSRLMEGVLFRLATEQLQTGDDDTAADAACRLIAMNPLNEAAHRLLIRAYVATGQRHMALRQYQACADILQAELGVAPEEATEALRRDIEAVHDAVELPGRVEAPRPPSSEPTAQGEFELPNKPSIAVMPFENLSGDPDQEFFADGMAEDIIAALSRYRWFFVIARNSSFSYKNRDVDSQTVARELGVRYLLEGSTRKAQGRVRVAANLIEASTGACLWVDQFERRLDDIFSVQEAIGSAITLSIERELAEAERQRARRKSPGTLDAWETYQRAIWHHMRYQRDDSVVARALFRRAIEMDPNFALAYARLAHAEVSAALLGFPSTPGHSSDDTLALADRSIALDANDPMCHYALGRVRSRQREHDNAMAELQAAIDLNPSFADAHFGLAQAKYASGHVESVVPLVETAIRLSPRDPGMWSFLAVGSRALLSQERYEEAVQWGYRAIEVPNTALARASIALISALGHLNQLAEAKTVLAKVRQRHPDFSIGTVKKGPLHHFKIEDQREHILDGLRKVGLSE